MLLNLSPPENLHKEMKQATQVILKVLWCREVYKLYSGKIDKDKFENKFPHLKNCCLVSKHFTALSNRSEAFFKLFPDRRERTRIRNALTLDLDFTKNMDCTNFSFSSCSIGNYNDEFQDKVRKYFEGFYDLFFSSKGRNGLNKRHKFKKEYETKNMTGSLVCPACLGELTLSKSQLDHYFPKSLYPALVIHPFNLVPICADCNTTVGTDENKGKGDKVPTSPTDKTKHNEKGCLRTVFIPYQRSGQKKITCQISNTPGNRRVYLKGLKGENQETKNRIDNHAQTFNIDNIWTGRIPSINNRIVYRAVVDFKRIFYQEKMKDKNAEISKDQLKIYLWEKYLHESDDIVYQLGDGFLTANYAAWLYQSDHGFEVFYKELQRRLGEEEYSDIFKPPHFFEEYT